MQLIYVIFGYHIAYRVVSYESKQLFYVDDNVRTRIYCTNHDLESSYILFTSSDFSTTQTIPYCTDDPKYGATYNDGIFVLDTSTKYNGTIPTLLSSVNVSRLFVKGFFKTLLAYKDTKCKLCTIYLLYKLNKFVL